MENRSHQTKPFTESVSVFFKRLFPTYLFARLNKDFGLDLNRKKLVFRTYFLLLLFVIITQPHMTSTRDIESASQRESIQMLTGQQPVSHTAIAERLKSIPSICMETLLDHLTMKYRKKLKHKSKFLRGMKVFDVTTFSVSAKHYNWVARKQSRGNLRILFVMDSRSGTPDAVINASKNLNDNKVFQQAIDSAKQADVFVFDKGFNSFEILRKIIDSGRHFITRFKDNYVFNILYEREINPNEKLEGNWELESDTVVSIGGNNPDTQVIVRKIVCRHKKTKKSFTVMSDERNWAANKIVQMYVYRWPIEVFFRYIKSNLKVVTFPSHDPQGVKNWILFIALSILVMQFISLDKEKKPFKSLMERKSAFKPLLRLTLNVFDQWLLDTVKEHII